MPSIILTFGKEIISVVMGHTTIQVPLIFFPWEARSSVQRNSISKAMQLDGLLHAEKYSWESKRSYAHLPSDISVSKAKG